MKEISMIGLIVGGLFEFLLIIAWISDPRFFPRDLGGVFAFTSFVLVLSIIGAITAHNKEKEERLIKDEMANDDINAEKEINSKWNLISKDFPIDKSVVMTLKLLDQDVKEPFMFYVTFNGESLRIIPKENISLMTYRQSGITTPLKLEIPNDKIQYYIQSGEILTNVSGSGGGSAYSMVTGWNGKTNPMTIKTNIIDKRHTSLFYENNGKDTIITFNYEDFHKLKRIIPLKDYEIVQSKYKKENQSNAEGFTNSVNSNDHSTRLYAIKKLWDDGLINEDEFRKKKEEIINQI